MSDEVTSLIDGATGGDPEGDAASAIIAPELLEEVRNSGKKTPPSARRPVEPEGDGADDDDRETDDGDDLPLRHSVPRSRGSSSKYARYRKYEVEAEAERLAQELEAARAELAQKSAEPDPNAIRDLAFTIKFAAGMAFKTAAIMRGPHWEITDPEADNIGERGAIAMGPLAADYAHLLPWINFAAALGAPIAARVAEDRRINRLNEMPPDAT